jgi:hypothetical protein
MNRFSEKIQELFDRIPRRHTTDNVKEMYSILDAYENLLMSMEADDRYEKQVARFFDKLEPIRATVKKSNDNKAFKKAKDVLFDEASGALKDTIEELMQLWKNIFTVATVAMSMDNSTNNGVSSDMYRSLQGIKTLLDVTWLKDKSLAGSDNLPDPENVKNSEAGWNVLEV